MNYDLKEYDIDNIYFILTIQYKFCNFRYLEIYFMKNF